MKKTATLFLGLAMAMTLAGFGTSTATAAGSATLTLSPSNTTVDTGDSFSLSVLVDPKGEELDTARVEISYDASLLEVTAFDLGSLFPYQSPANEINNTTGELSQGAFKFGDPVTSTGTFGTVTFRALSAGTATISVQSDSKLISDGTEKISTSSLGSSEITITGEDVEPVAEEPTTTTETPSTGGSTGTSTSASLEAQALVYYGALVGDLPSTGDEWEALHCIAYGGCQADPQDLTKEGQALALFSSKYGSLPTTSMEWNTIHAIAYTNVFIDWGDEEEVADTEEETEEVAEEEATEEETELSLEAQALVYFGAFYARMPSSGTDWEALHCIAYGGCQGDPRDLQAEQDALVLFGQKYAKMPSTSMEWNVLHTIAYTNLLTYDQQAEEEEVVEEEVVEEQQELTLEQQAIGWFGSLTGRLPSTEADWLAIDYMVNGYTPDEQDLEAEAAAIATFTAKFGYLPSSDQDWNIISAIAYSGAF